jgi:Ca2+/Na+ antiporter
MAPGKENYYPLSLFMATVWIWIYSFVIVWFTFKITMAFKLRFSVIPLVLYPWGIALRDQKKFVDMLTMVKVFKEKMPQQRISLAETFSGPIFQITGLMGTVWLIFMLTKGKDISFINEGIQY